MDYCDFFCGKIHILKVWFDLIYFTNIFDGVGGDLGKISTKFDVDLLLLILT